MRLTDWTFATVLLAAGAVAAAAHWGAEGVRVGADAASAGALTISVPGIPGPYCAYGIEKRVLELPSVARVELDWEREEIRVVGQEGRVLTAAALRAAVEASEYPYDYAILP
ncbi:MAG: hypothetical protein HY703_03545 [Gemmatimonadetes bacterium]|nr:hypothetical protein [Gemmatimonadota bacterium]